MSGFFKAERRLYQDDHLLYPNRAKWPTDVLLDPHYSWIPPSLAGCFHAEHQFKCGRPPVPAGLLPGGQCAVSLTAMCWRQGKTEKRCRNELSSATVQPESSHTHCFDEFTSSSKPCLDEAKLILRVFNDMTNTWTNRNVTGCKWLYYDQKQQQK